ncbi:transcription factor bHLH106-like [Cynara cardunculus var. scolymus]|uniref:BHLH domain-containing protein n=1 Tax=Cynara cardunculus var. scolymus TaxID=59895 RepID=A0A103Y6I6_CYNCS|nr:transcription factor bHLH106-like [Cynara cardunculus var. scolymus]KVI03434.1 hypothetical protein Ccrd_018270 [Cynara cardunculus var. scolymus]
MHSHLYHRSATDTTTGNRHLPPQMLLSGCTTTSNHDSSLLLDHYPCHESVTADSSPPSRSLSSSSASINHKEAEKRRRERINFHLNRLRTLLPCNSKTDKASLLAKVIERLKELKQITSEIEQLESFPSEKDEITVISLNNDEGNGRIVIKASMCCENRSDLLTDMIQTLKSLQLRPLRMEMVAMGGRIRNIILVECDCERDDSGELVYCLKEALSCLVKSNLDSNQSSKRRRMIGCR